MCIGTPPYFFYEFSFIFILLMNMQKQQFAYQHIK